jgi:hypothetical protein
MELKYYFERVKIALKNLKAPQEEKWAPPLIRIEVPPEKIGKYLYTVPKGKHLFLSRASVSCNRGCIQLVQFGTGSRLLSELRFDRQGDLNFDSISVDEEETLCIHFHNNGVQKADFSMSVTGTLEKITLLPPKIRYTLIKIIEYSFFTALGIIISRFLIDF